MHHPPHRKPRQLTLLLATGLAGLVVLSLAAQERPTTPQRTPPPTPQRTLQQSIDALSLAEPQFDREPFRESAQSIARADLLACRNERVAVRRPGKIDIDEFSRALNGVWLNQNRRTVHGMPVETDAAFYIHMDGRTGTAILIDRNNMGSLLAEPFTARGRDRPKVQRPLAIRQVNCTFQFVDEYVKVSDEVQVEALARTTGLRLERGADLVAAWKALVASGYFERFDMPTGDGGTREVKARLGDLKRVAVLPNGEVVPEKDINAGMVPGGEYELPMLTGALFRVTLTPVEPRRGAPHGGVRMRWDAEYRGAGIDLAPGEATYGVEQGDFFREGGAYVAARDAAFPRRVEGGEIATLESLEMDAFTTSTCADKNGLEMLAAVSNPAPMMETIRLATGEEVQAEVTPEFVFERMVIGVPGQV